MEFADLQKLAKKFERLNGTAKNMNEETTKQVLVVPFIKALGWDTGEPSEVVFEYPTGFGKKKDNHVDIVLLLNNQIVALVECKSLQTKLDAEDCEQLRSYFGSSAGAGLKAHVGILTNGRRMLFFTDMEEPNVMDKEPFLKINLEKLDESFMQMLRYMSKEGWNLKELKDEAVRRWRFRIILEQVRKDMKNPPDDLVKRYASLCHDGFKTKSVVEEFRPIVAEAFRKCLSGSMKSWLDASAADEHQPEPTPEPKLPADAADAARFEETLMEKMSPQTKALYEKLKARLCALPGVTVQPNKIYASFLQDGAVFLGVEPYKSKLGVYLNVLKGTLEDPDGLARDVSQVGHHMSSSDYLVNLADEAGLDAAMPLIEQARRRKMAAEKEDAGPRAGM